MELRHLECFVTVADEQNFTRAAARLHVVQSAVSASIKSLERELGATLLDRNSQRVLLTEAGAALLPRARVTLEAARDAEDVVAEVVGGLRGTLRIGTITALNRIIDLPGLLGEYHRRHPGVQLSARNDPKGSRGLAEALVERRLDLAFLSLPGGAPPGVTLRELAQSAVELAVPEDHPLAGRRSVRLQELAGSTFIDGPAGFGNREVVDRAFADAGLARTVSIEIGDIATTVDFVRHGLGVALTPAVFADDTHGVRRIPVAGTDLSWPLSLATPADREPRAAVRALIELVDGYVL